jgi:hypothetical protein
MDMKPSHPQMQEKIEEYRKFISRHFWTCSIEVYKALGIAYISNGELREYLVQFNKDLPYFLNKAIELYCEKREGENNERTCN